MVYYYNKKRLEGSNLKERDKVYLLRRNIKIKRENNKLDWKKIGSFKIEKKLEQIIYRLILLKTIKIYPIFYISLLELVSKNVRLDKIT